MNFQARYDDIINQIENAVYQKEDQIPEKLAKDTGIHLRVIADAFQFIAGMTLAQYIKQRRLVHALNYKQQTNCSLEKAAESFGFADSATMSKAFKNYFGVSPSQITPDDLEAIVPLTLDHVLTGESENSMDVTARVTKKSEMFGVDSEKFQAIKQALELSAVYGLSDKEAEYAYNLSRKHQVPLSTAFEFVEDLGLQKENGSFFSSLWNVSLDEIISLSFRKKLSVSESIDEIHRLHTIGVADVSTVEDEFLEIYFSDANSIYDFRAHEIEDFIEQMDEYGIPVADFDDLLLLGYEGTAEETIEQYKRYLKMVEQESKQFYTGKTEELFEEVQ